MEFCPYCGEIARLEVTELYIETREIVLDACCEWNLEGWIGSIGDFSRRDRVRWMREMTGLVVHDILLDGDTLGWTLHYGLEFHPIEFAQAKTFIQEHHRHCDPPPGWKYGISLLNGTELVGVMTAGRPGSRVLQEQGYMEVTRVCVKDMSPHGLVANACSILYGYACREAFTRGFQRVVTYTKIDESGASLRAAGFVPIAISKGGEWDRQGRHRRPGRNTGPKVRWERWKDRVLPMQTSFRFESCDSLPIAA